MLYVDNVDTHCERPAPPIRKATPGGFRSACGVNFGRKRTTLRK